MTKPNPSDLRAVARFGRPAWLRRAPTQPDGSFDTSAPQGGAATVWQALVALADAHGARKAAIGSDPDLTPSGRRKAVAATARETGAQLPKFDAALLGQLRRRQNDLRGQLAKVAERPADPIAARLDRLIGLTLLNARGYVTGGKPDVLRLEADYAAALARNDGVEATALESLGLLPQAAIEAAKLDRLRSLDGPVAAELADLDEALADVDHVISTISAELAADQAPEGDDGAALKRQLGLAESTPEAAE